MWASQSVKTDSASPETQSTCVLRPPLRQLERANWWLRRIEAASSALPPPRISRAISRDGRPVRGEASLAIDRPLSCCRHSVEPQLFSEPRCALRPPFFELDTDRIGNPVDRVEEGSNGSGIDECRCSCLVSQRRPHRRSLLVRTVDHRFGKSCEKEPVFNRNGICHAGHKTKIRIILGLQARTEPVGMAGSSVETPVQRGYPAGDQLDLALGN